ncbi:MAG TPA: MFS transporter [Cyanobacteria bacterium UBA8803]|nr:MFS transporter [Cyanobacteria bacterium UBA9273]HBL57538.1 MFS transporter [Cyanobacteria bacterium UBA8803]
MTNPPDAITLTAESEKLNLKTKLAYGVGELGKEIPGNILVFFLLFFLTNVAGLNPTLAGSVLLVSKVWDAINDPMIGWLSDRTRSPLGRRYPWMLWGAIPMGVCFFLLWFVPPTSNQWLLFAYYSGIGLLLDTALTTVALPHGALAAEITQAYDERTSLISFKAAFSIIASLLSLSLAQAIFAKITDPYKKYLILGAVCGVLIICAVYLCVWGTYKRYREVQTQRQQPTEEQSLPIKQQIQIAFSNFPFLCVIGIYLCSWLSLQVTAAMLPYFVINWMGLPDHHFTQAVLAVQGTALGMMFFWGAVAQRVGKRAVYCMGIPLTICALIGLYFLQPNQVGLLYILAAIVGLGLSTAYLVPWSMLPDVVDFDELNTGHRREGIFYGFVVHLQKVGVAIALFLVGKTLDWSGFISTTPGQLPPTQPDSALWAIRLLIGPIPALVLIGGLICAYFYPISRQRHGEILLQLIERRNV